MGGLAARNAKDNRNLNHKPLLIAVVGAGAAGLAAARFLQGEGHRVTVFDKGRRAGGRLALRETARGAFDHGASAVQLRASATLPGDWQTLIREGHLLAWPPNEEGSYTGSPAMQQLALHWAAGLELQLVQPVTRLLPAAAGWQLTLADGSAARVFDAVIVTVPLPQLAVLLPDTPLPPALARIAYDPCWTLLWTPASIMLPPLAQATGIEHAVLHALIREDLKPARSGPPRYIIHAQADWSRQWLEASSDAVAAKLQAEAAAWLDIAPDALHLAAHRWRYAQVRQALGKAQCMLAPGLHYASDGCLGRGIAGAIESGQAAAQVLLSTFEPAAA